MAFRFQIHTLKAKLTLWFCILVAVILSAFSFSVYFFYAGYRESSFENRLERKARSTAHLLLHVDEISPYLLKTIDQNSLTLLNRENVSIFDDKYNLIYSSNDEKLSVKPQFFAEIKQEKVTQIKTEYEPDKSEEELRESLGLLYNDKGKDYYVYISAIDVTGKKKLYNLKLMLLGGWLGGLLLTVIAGRFFAYTALRPINKLNEEISRIDAAQLHVQVDEGNRQDEIAQLAISFNKMLNRLRNAFESQRSFVTHASHELRTPLTAMRGQIEVALGKTRQTEDYQNLLKSLLEDLTNLSALYNGLLDLGKASLDPSVVQFQPLRIDETLWETRATLLKMQPQYHVSIYFDPFPEDESMLMVKANPPLITTCFLNLMENSCKYSNNQTSEVRLSCTAGLVQIQFSDSGPGVLPEDLPHIFEPFYRSEKTKHKPGHGLGLSLAQKITRLHDGEITIQSEAGHGVVITITLPCLQPQLAN